MASSSLSSGSTGLMCLEGLELGVVKTFKPTDAQLVGYYLYNQIMMVHGGNGKQTFPELDMYGKTGMVPWVIWDSYEEIKIPHQEYLYFFSRVKKMSKKGEGKRLSRTVGCGGTWSETEPAKPVYVDCFQEPFGKMRKLRYENKDKSFEHHSAWMIEEFSIDHHYVKSSDLVLCRMKRNENNKKRKRKFVEDGEENARRTKSFKLEQQLPSHSHHEQQQQVYEEWINVDDLFCGDNVEQQQQVYEEWINVDDLFCGDNVDEDQGSGGAQQQQIPSHHFDNNYNCTTDDAIVSVNESEHAELDDTGWLDALEEVDPNLSEQDSSAGHDLIMTVNESTYLQFEEGTDQNGSASEGVGGETLPPALSEKHTPSSPLMSQQQHLSSQDDDQTFNFACDNDIIPMDGAAYFQSDEFSNFNFHFENHYLSGEATLPQLVPHLGADSGVLFGW